MKPTFHHKLIRLAVVFSAITLVNVINLPASAEEAPVPTVLADGANAKSRRVEGMHKTRFVEIFLAHRDAKTGKLVAECYNTMFTSQGIPESKDTAPQAPVEGLDFEKMKKDFGVLGASLNGPKLWTSD
jgi:hypothetical protein